MPEKIIDSYIMWIIIKQNMKKFKTLVEKIISEMAFGIGKYKEIPLQELIDHIISFDNAGQGVNKASKASFTVVTVPQYRKTGFPYKKLYKLGQTEVLIRTDYESNVNAQREREGKEADFKAGKASGMKERISKSVAVTTKDLPVLVYRPEKSRPSFWFVETNTGEIQEVPKEEIASFLYVPSGNSNQGLESEISYRTIGFDKIIGMSFQGEEFMVSDADPIKKQIFNMAQDKLVS